MAEEQVDIHNCFNERIGTASKEQAHRNGLWHRAVAFIILDTKTKEIIFQHEAGPEDIELETFFVKLNGGHIQEGEKPTDGFRELEEELGLKNKLSSSVYAGTYQLSAQFSEDFINNEFIYFYIVPGDGIKDEMILDKREVGSIISVEVFEALETVLGKQSTVQATITDLEITKNLTLNSTHFKNFTDDNLYTRIFLAAKRYLEGEKEDFILV